MKTIIQALILALFMSGTPMTLHAQSLMGTINHQNGGGGGGGGIAFSGSADGGHSMASTSLTFSYTVNGSSNLLVVGALCDVTSDFLTGITYNGVALTFIGKHGPIAPSDSTRWTYLYYLLAPATGAHNVVISASSACDFILGSAADYSGVTALDNSNVTTATGSVSSITGAVTASTTGSWAVAFTNGDSGLAPAGGTGQTLRTYDTMFFAWLYGDSAGGTGIGSFSQTSNWPGGDSTDAIMIQATFK